MTNRRFPSIRGVINRRTFVGGTAAGAGLTLLPWGRGALGQDAAPDATPHFFLLVTVSGGADSSYLFDARPLVMTDKGKIQNYLYKNAATGSSSPVNPERLVYTGSNGGTLLRTHLTDSLMEHAADFTVLNGVQMVTNGFIGHGNNMYYLYTNNPNPGHDSFVPNIGALGGAPLESVHIGGLDGDGNQPPTNFAGSIQLQAGQGGNLAAALKNGPPLDLTKPAMAHVMARLAATAQGDGLFSVGAKKMQSALSRAPALADTLKNVDAAGAGTTTEVLGQLNIAMAYFRGGVTNAISLMYHRDPIIDTHSASGAQAQPQLFKEIGDNLAAVFATLKSTVFDASKSLSFLDVTTVMITSEFSRTMMQTGSAIDNTGTDHNPLTNTVLLAGKGIKTGMVVGASDLADVDDAGKLKDVSGAHKEKDAALLQAMGRPFDPATMLPRTDLPATFVETDYLSFPNVVNTVLDLFGVPMQQHFRLSTGVQAASVKGLLK